MADSVLYDVTDGVATVSVNRPEKRNALNEPTRVELRAAFEEAVEDDDVRAIVLRGEGDAFISGGDLETLASLDMLEAMEYKATYAQGLNNYIASLPKPTVAAIDGYALGGGLEMALACDIRLAANDAKVGFPEVNVGIFPGGGGTQRLTAVVGASVARELIYTGRIIEADEAADLGILNHLYDPDEFEASVDEFAADLASKPPVALQLAKRSIDRAVELEAGLDFELLAGTILFGTEDQKEGARAFLEDREPEFEGR